MEYIIIYCIAGIDGQGQLLLAAWLGSSQPRMNTKNASRHVAEQEYCISSNETDSTVKYPNEYIKICMLLVCVQITRVQSLRIKHNATHRTANDPFLHRSCVESSHTRILASIARTTPIMNGRHMAQVHKQQFWADESPPPATGSAKQRPNCI